MKLCAQYMETAQNRIEFYTFFARVYRVEIDEALLKNMAEVLSFDEEATGSFGEGAREVNQYLAALSPASLLDLKVDYARLFLGAGVSTSEAAYPYESVYTSEGHLVMQDSYEAMVKLLRKKGLAPANGSVEPADHIAFELEYMARLIEQGTVFAQQGDEQSVRKNIAEQAAFLSEHLLNWVPGFVADLERYASSDFYRGIGKMTYGLLKMDQEELRSLAESE